MKPTPILAALLLTISACSRGPAPAAHEGATTAAVSLEYGERLGTVRLNPSCNESATPLVRRGLALLHHMTYDGARGVFARAANQDPQCAMAYWGQAMTFVHPLWDDPPGEEAFQQGQAMVREALTRGVRSERERAMIDAVDGYYDAGWGANERPNLNGFAQGWTEAYRKFPDDLEITAFHALALLATADPADKTYQAQLEAAALTEKILAQVPDHPGGQHYLIHACDVPPLASRALVVARSYGSIAPEVPHALHMPTHIFTRLGLWEDSIEGNRRSAAAALEHPVGGTVPPHYYLHALDYLTYAYLQRADDAHAQGILQELGGMHGPFHVTLSTAYALAAIPARFVLERRDWVAAAGLQPRVPERFPWDRFPAMEAITFFARGLGAARSGDQGMAQAAVEALTTLQELAAQHDAYWARQVEIQRVTVEAWKAHMEGDVEGALRSMRAAADMETMTEKHAATPGAVLPARELLGDMLLESGRPEDALVAYEAALSHSPNRFNSLSGIARAAELAGDASQAAMFYSRLVENAVPGDTARESLRRARAYLARQQASASANRP